MAGVLRGRRLGVVAVIGFVVALIVGGQLDRAPTEGRYRPPLAPPAFAGRCDPLPDAVHLDLPYQVRADRPLVSDAGTVRRLDLHYDLLDETTAERRVVGALTRAGFAETDAPSGADPQIERWFELASYGRVGVAVRPFDVDADSIVRGALTIDVPTDTLTPAVLAECSDPEQTKRYPEYADPGAAP